MAWIRRNKQMLLPTAVMVVPGFFSLGAMERSLPGSSSTSFGKSPSSISPSWTPLPVSPTIPAPLSWSPPSPPLLTPSESAPGTSRQSETLSASRKGTPAILLACLRRQESSNNYADDTGNGFHGAYQFMRSTWDSVARHTGRLDLLGLNPAQALPSDQDAMAWALYLWQGVDPWPISGRRCA